MIIYIDLPGWMELAQLIHGRHMFVNIHNKIQGYKFHNIGLLNLKCIKESWIKIVTMGRMKYGNIVNFAWTIAEFIYNIKSHKLVQNEAPPGTSVEFKILWISVVLTSTVKYLI